MDNYDDIINLPHHVSKRHPQMSMWNRAAQFAPFAALTGYEESIKDTAQENEKMYEDTMGWNRMSLVNIANAGCFAADRSIKDYAETIWGNKPVILP